MTATAITNETKEWCVSRNHPYVTYNPQLDRTYCRCGERQETGEQPVDWRAKWEIFHDHEPGTPCNCYAAKALLSYPSNHILPAKTQREDT